MTRRLDCVAPGTARVLGLVLLLLVLLLVGERQQVGAATNRNFGLSPACGRHLNRYHIVDGAVVSYDGGNSSFAVDCIWTFQTHSVLQHFAVRFETLDLDCKDHLRLYDGEHAIGKYKVDLSCGDSANSLNILRIRSNYLTLRLFTDGFHNGTSDFTMVIAAHKDPGLDLPCRGFACLTGHCISEDLKCDGVDHCMDGSDEERGAGCSPPPVD